MKLALNIAHHFLQAYFTIDSRRLASMHKRSARNSKLLYGVKQFNLDPKKGLSVLQESGFLPSPAAVEKVTVVFILIIWADIISPFSELVRKEIEIVPLHLVEILK